MSEGEDAGGASDGCAGGLGQVLNRAGRGLGVGTVPPVVGHNSPICINLKLESVEYLTIKSSQLSGHSIVDYFNLYLCSTPRCW